MGIVIADISVTLDGFGAGPNHAWTRPSATSMQAGCTAGCSSTPTRAPPSSAPSPRRALVMGRNMVTPGRGGWDLQWQGWWGDDPPYHAPVFVLTHHEREPLPMDGGTTFPFVTGGIQAALDLARAAAGSGNIAIAGGATAVHRVPRSAAPRPGRRPGSR
ncbi:MAG: dihydrofolate reductase family protein [Acidimicrobiia bacterium]|nr:dihydrofolate reductase family protein [Acidimicrobiia bacterium]